MNLPFLKNRITTKWWENRVVGEDILETLMQTAYLAPSKQNYYDWRCIVLTQSEEGRRIKKELYEKYTWSDSNSTIMGTGPGPRKYNGQYLAPVLFVWLSRWRENKLDPRWAPEKTNHEIRNMHTHAEVGIAAGSVMTTAEAMGLNTGFGLCHDSIELAKIMGYPEEFALLALGVGYGVKDPAPPRVAAPFYASHKDVVINDEITGVDLINIPPEVTYTSIRARKPLRDTILKVI